MDIEKRINLSQKRAKAKLIIKLVNEYFSVNCDDGKRNRKVMLPRQIAIYLIYNNIVIGTAELGKLFKAKNNKTLDHSTIWHNNNKIQEYLDINDKLVVKHINNLKKDAKRLSEMSEKELNILKVKELILDKLKGYTLKQLIEFKDSIK